MVEAFKMVRPLKSMRKDNQPSLKPILLMMSWAVPPQPSYLMDAGLTQVDVASVEVASVDVASVDVASVVVVSTGPRGV